MAREIKTLPFVLATKGLVNIAFGAGMAVLPQTLMAIYGVEVNGAGIFIARLFGAVLLGVGAVQFLGRRIKDGETKTLLIGALAGADLLGFVFALLFQLQGGMNELGWGVVALYAYAGFGFSYGFVTECFQQSQCAQA